MFAGALAGCSNQALKKLAELLTALGLAPLVGQRELTIDFDSSVVVSFGEHEGAVFGYCGKGRNRRRHHPLVASVDGVRTVVHADYRDGTAIKEGEIIAFFTETLRRVEAGVGAVKTTLRADSDRGAQPLVTRRR